MLIALWIINAVLALAFLAAGVMKLTRSRPQLEAAGMGWVEDFSPTHVRLIAVAEVVGAIGLILPLLTGIAPILSALAALGLAIIMGGAVIVHARRKEPLVPPLVLLSLSIASAVLGFLVVNA